MNKMIPEQFYVGPNTGEVVVRCAHKKCSWEQELGMGWIQIGIILEKAKKHLEEKHNDSIQT